CFSLRGEAGLSDLAPGIVIPAALLHDSLEDCAVSVAELESRFGAEVTGLVLALTKPRLRKRETPETRLARFTRQIAMCGPAAVFIKCCDLMHNVSDLDASPPEVL